MISAPGKVLNQAKAMNLTITSPDSRAKHRFLRPSPFFYNGLFAFRETKSGLRLLLLHNPPRNPKFLALLHDVYVLRRAVRKDSQR
jgi:hypothetical protein